METNRGTYCCGKRNDSERIVAVRNSLHPLKITRNLVAALAGTRLAI
jgi:hypothetical protein